ncbi:MAG TPA: (2Fe-2S)-binding protein [Alphaproteobacteria bacterium]|nr:(2Fe-2S)-binding protein [Alphaproteobacteria bacterium]
MAENVKLTVNGTAREIEAEGEMPLLYALRDLLGLTGTKYGCGVEQCGSCCVLIDGERAVSCKTTVAEAAGRDIVTIEGISDGAGLHPLQTAFIEEHAFQCGYCTPGIIISAKALLDKDPDPSEAEIATALQDNLCRCGSHPRVIKAVRRAARELAK